MCVKYSIIDSMRHYYFAAVLCLFLLIFLEDTSSIYQYTDKKISLVGELSDIPWQHMIAFVEGHPYSEYFDIRGYQIVIYSETAIDCPGKVRVYGTVIKVQGKGKRPDPGDELYTEYHLVVDEWECLH
jgi:hypothetical protein